MSDEQADAIYGRLSREVGKLAKDVALYESELKRIGKNLEATGQQLQRLNLTVSREMLERDLPILWDSIEKFKQASVELADKKSQRDKIDTQS